MSTNGRPPTSSVTSQRNPPKIKKAPAVSTEARKPQLFKRHATFTGSDKAKNEPMKPTAVSLPIKADHSGQNQSGGSNNSSLPGSSKTKRLHPKESGADVANNLYQLYLQNYILNGLGKMKVLRKSSREKRILGVKAAGLTACQPNYQKKVWKRITNCLFEHLKHLKVIEGTFVNLVDFAGEETLVEIQTILMEKYDKIMIEGKELDEPLFQEGEIEILEELLKNHLLQCKEETKVAGFCKSFSLALQRLRLKTNKMESDGSDQKRFNIELLESLSLECSDLAIKEKMDHTNSKSKSSFNKIFDLNELMQQQPHELESEGEDDGDQETVREEQCKIA